MAIEGDELSKLNVQDQDATETMIKALLHSLQSSLNITSKLTIWQSLDISKKIIATYPYLKLDELILVFENMKKGRYVKFYNSIDSSIIFSCIDAYLASEERALYFERINHNLKVGCNYGVREEEITVDSPEAKAFFETIKKVFEEKTNPPKKEVLEPKKIFSSSEQYLEKTEKILATYSEEELVEYLRDAQRAGYRDAIELVKKEMLKRKTQENE